MSKNKKEKIIHVENLIIHAKNVDFIHERDKNHDKLSAEMPRRSPWDSFWLSPPTREENEEEEKTDEKR
ncbi:hypothetical protein [Bacillus sp. J33]|uniref:hypothetical protein n=1 Tax=Bacillus sp. J33 TaxID=935836 RepID=UPI00047D03CA|nr:hypothetical protein [Bacillus sp. J33]